MMKLILRYVVVKEAAKDILHDGFLLVFSQIHSLKDDSKLESWMARIMRNICLQYLKDLDLYTILAEDAEFPDVPSMESIISMEELDSIIDSLPDGYKTIFRLSVLDGLSHKEIGSLLGIAPHSSSSQLARAKAMLRDILKSRLAAAGTLGILAIILIPLVIIIFNKNKNSDNTIVVATNSGTRESTVSNQHIEHRVHKNVNTTANLTNGSVTKPVTTTKDSIPTHYTPLIKDNIVETEADTAKINEPIDSIGSYPMSIPDERYYAVNVPTGHKGSLGISVSYQGIAGGVNLGGANGNPIQSSPLPGPDIPSDVEELLDSKTTHHLPQIVSLNLQQPLTPSISLDYGLSYTFRRTDIFEKYRYRTISADYRAHFIGVSFKANYQIYSSNRFNIYGSLGTWVDFPVRSSLELTGQNEFETTNTHKHFSVPVQWSLTGGIGMEYMIVPQVGIYLEPSFRFNLNRNDNSKVLIDKPLEFTLPVGLRFKF